MKTRHIIPTAGLLLATLIGCQKPLHFPAKSLPEPAKRNHATAAYDTNANGQPDFFTFSDKTGRINRIGYDTTGDGRPDAIVQLDAITVAQSRHLVIILDGFSYELVQSYYDAGGLRWFNPPSRVIAPYPVLTDLCMEDLLGYIPCPGFEAEYYDHEKNVIVGGAGAYLRGENEPYNRLLNYRADLIMDTIGYLDPPAVFGKELNDAMQGFEQHKTKEYLAYFVSTAGMGTRSGAKGQRAALQEIDRFVTQVIWQTHGLTKVTLLSDHGHSYTSAKRIGLEKYLTDKGWRLKGTLHDPKDVVYIRFGLETYASFSTLRPSKLATDLSTAEGVDLTSYADGDTVVVLGQNNARATIARRGNSFAYRPTVGDPLKLKPILAKLTSDSEGYYDADVLLDATVNHDYPAPLQRLWRAHFALVEHPPDVIITLDQRYYSGQQSFASSINVASTHGGLHRSESVTFIMSTIAPLPELMRSRGIPNAMETMLGTHWPTKE